MLKNTEETRNWLNTQTNDIYGSPIVAIDTGKLEDIKAKFCNLASEPTQPNLWLPSFYALRAKVITDENFAIVQKNFYKLTSLTAI